jgi:hypothetical protein
MPEASFSVVMTDRFWHRVKQEKTKARLRHRVKQEKDECSPAASR